MCREQYPSQLSHTIKCSDIGSGVSGHVAVRPGLGGQGAGSEAEEICEHLSARTGQYGAISMITALSLVYLGSSPGTEGLG